MDDMTTRNLIGVMPYVFAIIRMQCMLNIYVALDGYLALSDDDDMCRDAM